MAASRPDEAPEATNADPAPMRRILGARWVVGVLAALVLALYFGGSVTAAGAMVLLLGLVLVTAFVPRSSSAGRLLAEPGPAPAAWPETGIKRFADALPDPCFVLDRRGIVRYANERAIAAFSIRVGEPLTFACACPTSPPRSTGSPRAARRSGSSSPSGCRPSAGSRPGLPASTAATAAGRASSC